jgi:hypothetical protein
LLERAHRPRQIGALRRGQRLHGPLALAVFPALVAAGCGPTSSALIDSYPITLARAPMGGPFSGDGALLGLATDPRAPNASFPMVVDTGSPITALQGVASSDLATFSGGFDLWDPTSATPPPDAPLRASFRGLDMLALPLGPAGDGSVATGGVLGANLLRGYSVGMRFGAPCGDGSAAVCSSLTFWDHLGADEGFLEDAGYAVYRFAPYGGGEVTAEGPPDFFGARAPLVLPATRIVLRTCAVPAAFAPSDPVEACCSADAANLLSTGVNLSLLLATGIGPVVLSQSAFDRVAIASPTPLPPPTDATPSLFVATWPTPIVAAWSTIPRLAFVDLEAGGANDPGACVELGRARRTEQVSYRRVRDPGAALCQQPCDADPREPNLAQSSAAYLELGGAIPVAIVSDDEPFLQGLAADVQPEGPQLDGLVGAGALGRSQAEIDYLSSQPRVVFSCEADAPRDACWAAARCPRLPDAQSVHYCFGLPAHGLPPTCAPTTCPL